MMAEQEVTSLEGQLTSIRKTLVKSQADNDKLKKLLHKQVSELELQIHQHSKLNSPLHLTCFNEDFAYCYFVRGMDSKPTA